MASVFPDPGAGSCIVVIESRGRVARKRCMHVNDPKHFNILPKRKKRERENSLCRWRRRSQTFVQLKGEEGEKHTQPGAKHMTKARGGGGRFVLTLRCGFQPLR